MTGARHDDRSRTRMLALVLSGGIGNLLFQYAAGVGLAERHHRRLQVVERTHGAVARLERLLDRRLPVCDHLQGAMLRRSPPPTSTGLAGTVNRTLSRVEVKRGAVVSEWEPRVQRPEHVNWNRVLGVKG